MALTFAFRSLLVFSVLTGLCGVMIDLAVPALVPGVLDAAYSALASSEETGLVAAVGLGLLALLLFAVGLVALVGLFLFKPWSRELSLAVTLLSLLTFPPLGPVVYSGWAFMLLQLSVLCWGAALALAYGSTLKARFPSASSGRPADRA